jgi:hypothetical protein
LHWYTYWGLVKLPYGFASDVEREAANDTIIKIEVVPTPAVTSIALSPGLASVLAQTRETEDFERLQEMLAQLGSASSDLFLPTEAVFNNAWENLSRAYSDISTRLLTKPSIIDEQIPRYSIYAYILARVCGFIILPMGPFPTDVAVAADYSAIRAVEHWGPSMIKGFRALLKWPRIHQSIASSARVRCSKVPLNKKPK